eukprot:scaffold330074_cov62-Tisochrysis_lutea.AAC.2
MPSSLDVAVHTPQEKQHHPSAGKASAARPWPHLRHVFSHRKAYSLRKRVDRSISRAKLSPPSQLRVVREIGREQASPVVFIDTTESEMARNLPLQGRVCAPAGIASPNCPWRHSAEGVPPLTAPAATLEAAAPALFWRELSRLQHMV